MRMNLADFNVMKKVETAAVENIKALAKDMHDIAESQDELTKALVSTYQLLKLIAEKLDIQVPKPLVDMTIENEITEEAKQ